MLNVMLIFEKNTKIDKNDIPEPTRDVRSDRCGSLKGSDRITKNAWKNVMQAEQMKVLSENSCFQIDLATIDMVLEDKITREK